MSRTEFLWIAVLVLPVTAAYVTLAQNQLPPAGGLVGHGLGILGFLLMLFAWLGYSWRKRETQVGPGTMQQWLAAHVVTGVAGPYFLLLHSAFSFHGLAGALSLLTLCLVLSGLAGRFLFTRLPRQRDPAYPDIAPELDAADETVATATRRLAVVRARGALWWPLHVPLAAAVMALALVHIVAALYYGSLLR